MSLLKESSGIIGNSSSGISEAPMLNIPTLNIGNRKKGRIILKSIYNSSTKQKDIINNLKKIIKHKSVKNFNPYGKGNASRNIIKKIKKINF